MGRLLTAAAALLLAAPALSQEGSSGTGRFEITPSEDGFTRLDTQTGAVSRCGKRDGVWYCETLPGAGASLERKLDDLADAVMQLSDEFVQLSARLDALDAGFDEVASRPLADAAATAADNSCRAEAVAGLSDELGRVSTRLDALGVRIDQVGRLADQFGRFSARINSLAARLDEVAAARYERSAGATAEDGDEALGFAEQVMRRFFDMVRQMKQADANRI